jgi:hypothetical protein
LIRSLGGWTMIKKLRLKGQDRIRRKVQVEARDLLCYWAVRELGISCTDLAKQLELRLAKVQKLMAFFLPKIPF